MYNEQIEALISAALTDGKLTEKEKQVLMKRAKAQGIDLDEFEIILDARLVELEKAEKAKQASKESNKHGEIRKCPSCGATISSIQGICPECGFEFTGVEANYSSQKLAEDIIAIQIKYNDKIDYSKDEDKKWELRKQSIDTIAQIIKSFPLPTTKSDLFEFIASMQVKMSDTTAYKQEGAAYFSKYKEAMIKASALFNNDPLFLNFIKKNDRVIALYNQNHKKQKRIGSKPSNKKLLLKYILWSTPFLLLTALIFILWQVDLLGSVLSWIGDALIAIGEALLCILFIAAVIFVILLFR